MHSRLNGYTDENYMDVQHEFENTVDGQPMDIKTVSMDIKCHSNGVNLHYNRTS